MTETTFAASPRLERPRDGGFKGVCAALARSTGTDLVLWRVLFVVLSFFGGVGIVLYIAGIVAIPEEGEERSVADRLLHGPDRHLERNQILLVIVFAVAAVSLLNDRDGVIAALVLGALAVMWWRNHTPSAPTVAAPAVPVTAEVVAAPPPRPERPPVRRSPFVGLTLSLATVTAGVLVLIGTGSTSVPAEVVQAAALGVVGVGLVVGSFFGRSTRLVVVALLLGVSLAVTLAVRPAIDAGVGDRSWTPVGSGSYRLGVGDATLDLRDLRISEAATYRIDARVDVGHLLVLVPTGMRVAVDATAQLGDLEVFGVESNGRHVHKQVDPDGRPQVALELSVRTGQVEVRRG